MKSNFMALTCDEVDALALAVVDKSGSGKSGKGGFSPASTHDPVCVPACVIMITGLTGFVGLWGIAAAYAWCERQCRL